MPDIPDYNNMVIGYSCDPDRYDPTPYDNSYEVLSISEAKVRHCPHVFIPEALAQATHRPWVNKAPASGILRLIGRNRDEGLSLARKNFWMRKYLREKQKAFYC